MLHLVEFQHLPHFSIDKGCTIGSYDSVRYPKSKNYILFDEICHNFSGGFVEWYSLYPLGEIFCSYKDPYVPIRRWIDQSYQVMPLGMERQWSDHALQALWVRMDQISLHLATVALFTNSTTSFFIVGQYQPICNMQRYNFYFRQCSPYSSAFISFNISLASFGPKHHNGSPSYPFLKRILTYRK